VPEAGAAAVEACAFSGVAEVLAGEAAGDDVDGVGVVELAGIRVDDEAGPASGDDAPAGLVVLARPGDVEAAGRLEAEVESHAAGEH
jgi:hypothetical protein